MYPLCKGVICGLNTSPPKTFFREHMLDKDKERLDDIETKFENGFSHITEDDVRFFLFYIEKLQDRIYELFDRLELLEH